MMTANVANKGNTMATASKPRVTIDGARSDMASQGKPGVSAFLVVYGNEACRDFRGWYEIE